VGSHGLEGSVGGLETRSKDAWSEPSQSEESASTPRNPLAALGLVPELADSGRDERTTRDASDSSQIRHIDGDIVTAAFAVRLGRGGAAQTY
jgi:hypothetical protein